MERSLGEVELADRAAELLADGLKVAERNPQRVEELGAAFDQVFRDGHQSVDSDLKGLGHVARKTRPRHGGKWKTVTVHAVTSLALHQARPDELAVQGACAVPRAARRRGRSVMPFVLCAAP
ncbi:hypothetical protein ACQP1W_32285 [Spirillospora sp. CA-255316]